MQVDVALRWSWMNVLTFKRYEALLAQFGSLEIALENVSLELLQSLGCREETAIIGMNRIEEMDTEQYARELQKRGIQLITIDDDIYPSALRQIDDRPIFLHAIGDLSILDQPCLALVGTRGMSDYGRRVTGLFIPEIVSAGMVTVSGLAYGIDAEVASETLRAGGKTVAVLGHGLGMIYPKANQVLAKDIVEKGGLVLSEFPLDIRPDKFTFPARNRIIAGLSLGTVVIEAAEGSGSLITAELALDYNRDVFAVPGQIFDVNYAGCHQLISKGTAKLVTTAKDVLTEIGIVASARAPEDSSFTPDSPEEDTVYQSLTSMPSAIDDIAVKTALDAASLSAILTVLELKGAVENVGAGKWVRKS